MPGNVAGKSLHRGIEIDQSTATQAMLTIGNPTSSHVRLMRRRSPTSTSSGSTKMSMVSKPISLVLRMPNAVSGLPARG